jgi:hypothetical protein
MGTEPAQIEQEIEQQRSQIGRKVAQLQDRLRSDLSVARSRGRYQASRLTRRTSRSLAMAALGGSTVFALGFLLGRTLAGRRR